MAPDEQNSNPSVRQKIVLNEETRDAIQLIESGLGSVQRIDGANDFYHAPFLLLASGFERLLKLILFLEWLESHGSPPREKDLYHRGKEGHSVERLLELVLERCYPAGGETLVPALDEDQKFMASNPVLRDIVEVLSDFGRKGRYANLDVLFEDEKSEMSPKQKWEKLELDILTAAGLTWEQLKERDFADLYGEINQALVRTLERFAGALARLFTLGPLGKLGKAQTATIGPFLNLWDEDLGKRKYV